MALERPNELVCPRKEEASPEERMIYQVLSFYIMTTHSLGYGVMVNITVSHTVAPGSIPGTRKHFRLLFLFFVLFWNLEELIFLRSCLHSAYEGLSARRYLLYVK